MPSLNEGIHYSVSHSTVLSEMRFYRQQTVSSLLKLYISIHKMVMVLEWGVLDSWRNCGIPKVNGCCDCHGMPKIRSLASWTPEN